MFFFPCTGSGLVIGCSVSIGYVVYVLTLMLVCQLTDEYHRPNSDSYPNSAWSALTATMALKNYLSFSVAYWAGPWVSKYDILSVMGTIGGIHFAIGLYAVSSQSIRLH
jgi:hypothetical protein